jgi:hypothetical protein
MRRLAYRPCLQILGRSRACRSEIDFIVELTCDEEFAGGLMLARSMIRIALGAVLGAGAGAMAIGCTLPGQPSPGEIARAQQAIINGQPSPPDDDAAILIPLFQNGQFFGTCSGVVIAPNLVLTARHCVSNTNAGAVACAPDGTPLDGGEVLSDRAASDLGVIVGAALKLTLDASGTQIFTTGADTLCNNDIGLILLDKPLTVPFAEVRLQAPPTAGENFRAVGWGVSNNSSGFSRRFRDPVPIVKVGPAADDSGVSGIGPNEFEVGESICEGDSGGPAFDDTTRAVIGVVSRGGNGKVAAKGDPADITCVDGPGFMTQNIYTRIDGFPDLFNQAFAAAGTDPWIEGGPDPRKAKTGEACTTPDDCRSGICIEAGKTGYCTQTCDGSAGSCTAPMSCATSNGMQVCKLPKHGCAMAPGARDSAGSAIAFACLALLFAIRRRVA